MRRILLVEDEKMIRYGIYVMIENSGVPYSEITECRNGRDAVECLKKDRYDLCDRYKNAGNERAGAFKVDI